MIHKLLVIPIQLDVLRVEDEVGVAGPPLDFTRLPWANSPAHRHSPYLGETLATEAFEDRHRLRKGLHCHWSLPLALTQTGSLGLVYRQSFQSVFGPDGATPDQPDGEQIWRRLVDAGWLAVIDEHTGVARAQLPDEGQRDAWLRANLPPGYDQAVRRLLLTPVFPPVPNRWLLRRSRDGQVTSSKLIESDYLWPAGQERLGDTPLAESHTVYPRLTSDPAEQPYRYLGRATDYAGSLPPLDEAHTLDSPLTAVGYGEPAFAAFYPICRSVFGHYDERLPASGEEQIELIGLYADAEQDAFKRFRDAFQRQWQAEHQTGQIEGPNPQHRQQDYLYLDLLDAVHRQMSLVIPVVAPRAQLEAIAPDEGAPLAAEQPDNAWGYLLAHRWIDEAGGLLPKAYSMMTIAGAPFQTRAEAIRRALNEAIAAQLPDRLVCYARVACPTQASPLPAVVNDQVNLSLGNSPTEALAALLASELSPGRQSAIEDQLEAIQFAATLQQTTVDTGAIFEALRHEKQFRPVDGGQRWVIRVIRDESRKAADVAEDETVTLPEEVGNPLNQLNLLEGQKTRNEAAIGSLRRQIYADWCRYLIMESALKGPRPQFAEPSGNPFGTQLGYESEERWRRIAFGTRVRRYTDAAAAEPSPTAADDPYTVAYLAGFKAFISGQIEEELAALLRRQAALGEQLSAQYDAVQRTLRTYQAGRPRPGPVLELIPRAASRYWRPNDPVIFLSGFDRSARHPTPRRGLPARLVAVDSPRPAGDLAALFAAVPPGQVDSAPAGDWQPLFLSWDVAFSQAHQPEDETYGPDYLRRHYRLGNVDFEPAAGPIAYESPVPLYGRAILTSGAAISLKQTLISRLTPAIYGRFIDEAVNAAAGQQPTIARFNAWLRQIDPAAGNLPLDDSDLSDESEIKQWLAEELDRQSDTGSAIMQHLLAALGHDSHQPIIRQYLAEPGAGALAGDLAHFLTWAEARTHLKADFAAQLPNLAEPLDIALTGDGAVVASFLAYLRGRLGAGLGRYYDEMAVAADQRASYLDDHYNEIIAWYQPQVSEALHLVVEIRAFQTLLGIRGLAQTFSGFGDGLIRRHQAFQLPVNNPFPHDGDHAFTAQVRAAVQTANTVAPGEHLPFAPWRAGKMALSELELLDSFGRYWPPDDVADLEAFAARAADTLPDVGQTPGWEFALPPRLAQGARLGFRWLAAQTEIEEINERPVSNPICGWVVPNHLDDSLMIYGPDGDALGSIDEGGHWRTFPGNRAPVLPADIANPHLAQVVQWLCAQGAAFLADFLDTLDLAHENMAPESYAQYESTALLLGHPLAVARADVSFELQEPPAIDISRARLLADVQAHHDYQKARTAGDPTPPGPPPRHTHHFEQVQIPLRLGEFHRLNDGLVGYWVEDGRGGYAGDAFYAPQIGPTPGQSQRIVTRRRANSEDRDEQGFLLYLSPDGAAPLKLTLLLDPRMPIHATAGVVPVEALAIASDQYQAALQRLQVAFLAAPLLAPELGMELSLPTEPGFEWRWVQRDGHNWTSISAEGILSRHQLQEAFGDAAGPLWAALLRQGWLVALGDDTARMVAENERAQPDLPPPFAAAQEAVELLFYRLRVRPFDTTARFDSQQQIREGWLRLSLDQSKWMV